MEKIDKEEKKDGFTSGLLVGVAICVIYFTAYVFCYMIPGNKKELADYKKSLIASSNNTVLRFQDSCLQNVDNPKVFNAFADSANKYIHVNNFLIEHKDEN